MNKYVIATIVISCATAVMMTFIKEILLKSKKDKVNSTLWRAAALAISAIVTVMSWWIFKIPEELKGCLLYVFVVYTIQEIFDLDVIKRIIKGFVKAKLRKQGLTEKDLDF